MLVFILDSENVKCVIAEIEIEQGRQVRVRSWEARRRVGGRKKKEG